MNSCIIESKSVVNNDPRSLPKNYPDCPILCNRVFDNFILADELFAKALQNLQTCVLVNNNLFGKLVSSLELPITFHERIEVTTVSFFVPDYNLLSCELDNFTFMLFC